MKKKIKDLTLKEIQTICKNCEYCDECPIVNFCDEMLTNDTVPGGYNASYSWDTEVEYEIPNKVL